MTDSSTELLKRYREIQMSEGLTIADENAIARAQGQAWREYKAACIREGVTPASMDLPGFSW